MSKLNIVMFLRLPETVGAFFRFRTPRGSQISTTFSLGNGAGGVCKKSRKYWVE